MASISRQINGRRVIQFVAADKRRRSIRLGKVSQRTAEAVKVRVEQLVTASITGHAPDDETARWVARLDDVMASKLASVGLIPNRESQTLGPFLSGYIKGRTDTKAGTRIVYRHTQGNLIDHFGPDKPLRGITRNEADGWRLYLVGQGLADNTVRRRCGIAKQFMAAAIRQGLFASNPFADLKSTVQANSSRDYFITRDMSEQIIAACPDSQWRLIFSLCRYGGLRCPSEVLGLTWADIDWARNRIRVTSPKTAHHSGGQTRAIPLFPELVPQLREAFEEAEPGTEWVVTRYRDARQNLRTTFGKIIHRAGLEPWPKLFQNLRSTRETELAEKWPIHVVCAWLGNSPVVAAKHYLQTTDAHFAEAAGALQNPVQQSAAAPRKQPHHLPTDEDENAVCGPVRPISIPYNGMRNDPMGEAGFEPARPVRARGF